MDRLARGHGRRRDAPRRHVGHRAPGRLRRLLDAHEESAVEVEGGHLDRPLAAARRAAKTSSTAAATPAQLPQHVGLRGDHRQGRVHRRSRGTRSRPARPSIMRLPVSGAALGGDRRRRASRCASQTAVPLDARTKSLPLLYLNSFNMTRRQQARRRGRARQQRRPRPDLRRGAAARRPRHVHAPGRRRCGRRPSRRPRSPPRAAGRRRPRGGAVAAPPTVVESDTYSLEFDATSNCSRPSPTASPACRRASRSVGMVQLERRRLHRVQRRTCPRALRTRRATARSRARTSSGPTRRSSSTRARRQTPTVEVVKGPLVTEVHQTFSSGRRTSSASTRASLRRGRVDGGADPDRHAVVPAGRLRPEEQVEAAAQHVGQGGRRQVRLGPPESGTWYTDSNGKEMVPRVYNKRGPSYPHPYNISEEVAGNYYPVNALMSLDDGTHELAVLTDVSQAGASLKDGALELMVHRRLQDDDSRGVQEPLNETMCGCNDIGADPGKMGAHGHEGDGGCVCAGLTVRGKHWLIFDGIADAHAARRKLSEDLNFPPLVALTGSSPASAPATSARSPQGPSRRSRGAAAKREARHAHEQLRAHQQRQAAPPPLASLRRWRAPHPGAAGDHRPAEHLRAGGPQDHQPPPRRRSRPTSRWPPSRLASTSGRRTCRPRRWPISSRLSGGSHSRSAAPFDFPQLTLRLMEVRTPPPLSEPTS